MPDWEYLTVYYDREASLKQDGPGKMIWSAKIKWPAGIEIRDEVPIEDVLNDLGQDGWELVTRTEKGPMSTDFMLKRQASGS